MNDLRNYRPINKSNIINDNEKFQLKSKFRFALVKYLNEKFKELRILPEYRVFDYIKSLIWTPSPNTQFESLIGLLWKNQVDVDDWWYLFPYIEDAHLKPLINEVFYSFELFRMMYLVQLTNVILEHVRFVNVYQKEYISTHRFEIFELFVRKSFYSSHSIELFKKYLNIYVANEHFLKFIVNKYGQYSFECEHGMVPNVQMLEFLDKFVKSPGGFDRMIDSSVIEFLSTNKDFEKELLNQ